MTSEGTERAPEGSIDALVERLRDLRVAADSPSFGEIARRIGHLRAVGNTPVAAVRPGRVTVYDIFRTGRSRLDVDLLVDIVRVLDPSQDTDSWRAAYRVASGAVRPAPTNEVRPRVAPMESSTPLVGREVELARVLRALAAVPSDRTAVAVVTGLPGMGKSALARTLAEQIARPGQVIIEAATRSGPGGTPASAEVVAHEILQVSSTLTHPSLEDGTPDRRLVVLLDDAPDPAAVAEVADALPLGSRLIAASRRALRVPGAITERLTSLEPVAASALLVSLLEGALATAPDPADVNELVRLSGYVPLGITVLAADVRTRQDWSLRDHIRRLQRTPPDALVPALEAAYAELTPPQALALRLLSLHPARLDAEEAAVLIGVDDLTAVLAALLDRHLLNRADTTRYDLHDVVRTFAADRSQAEDSFSVRAAAIARLADSLIGQVRQLSLADPEGEGSFESEEAQTWLATHLEVLVTTTVVAADYDLAERVSGLSALLGSPLFGSGRFHDAILVHGTAMRSGSNEGRSSAELHLIESLLKVPRNDEALGYLLRRRAQQSEEDPATLRLLALVHQRIGRLPDALSYIDSAVDAALRTDDPVEIGPAYALRSALLDMAGRFEEMERDQALALEQAIRIDDRVTMADVALARASYALDTGAFKEVVVQANEALRLSDERTGHVQVTRAKMSLGAGLVMDGQVDEGLSVLGEVREEAIARGVRHLEVTVSLMIGRMRVQTGSARQAVPLIESGLTLARQLRLPDREMHGVLNLGEAHLALNEFDQAQAQIELALAMAREQGHNQLEPMLAETLAEIARRREGSV